MGQKLEKLALDQLSVAAGGAIGTGMGMLLGNYNDRRQVKQQRRLNELDYEFQTRMANDNYARQMQFWEDTNYAAQKDQLMKAGLNPALMYGMGGGGGTTTGTATGGVNPANAPTGGGEVGMALQHGMQLQLLKAQKENIEADTEVKQAEAANKGASTELTKVNIDLANIEKEIKGETMKASIYIVKNLADQAVQDLNIKRNQGMISENTWSMEIDKVEAELAGIIAKNELTKAQTNLSNEQASTIAKQIELEYAKLKNETDKTKIQQKLQEFETSFGGQASGILKTLVEMLPGVGGKKGR